MEQPSIITGVVPGPPPETFTNSPGHALRLSSMWLLLSTLMLDVGISRVLGLRAAHRHVSPLRYANIVFWSFIVPFWLWQLFAAIKRNRKQRKELDQSILSSPSS